MHCNGRCQLMKKLKQADKNEQKQIPQTLKEKLDGLYCDHLTRFIIDSRRFITDKKQYFFDFQFLYSFSFQNDIFRPPQFCLI